VVTRVTHALRSWALRAKLGAYGEPRFRTPVGALSELRHANVGAPAFSFQVAIAVRWVALSALRDKDGSGEDESVGDRLDATRFGHAESASVGSIVFSADGFGRCGWRSAVVFCERFGDRLFDSVGVSISGAGHEGDRWAGSGIQGHCLESVVDRGQGARSLWVLQDEKDKNLMEGKPQQSQSVDRGKGTATGDLRRSDIRRWRRHWRICIPDLRSSSARRRVGRSRKTELRAQGRSGLKVRARSLSQHVLGLIAKLRELAP
jgi:hypothetical protein